MKSDRLYLAAHFRTREGDRRHLELLRRLVWRYCRPVVQDEEEL